MNPAPRPRPDLRDQSRRRVSVATRASLLAGAVLAAAFGVALARHDTATADAQQPADTSATPSATGPADTPAPTTTTPPPSTVTPAPTGLQPPVQVPTRTTSRGSHGRSGGS